MPQRYIRKIGMGLVPHERMFDAVRTVVAGTKNIRKAVDDAGRTKSTLCPYVGKSRADLRAELAPDNTSIQGISGGT